LHVCPLQYSSRTLPATQLKPGLLADKLSEVQMSYFYLCLSVGQYLWIIKFREWAYRKKGGDMRGYFHRFGYWGFIFRLSFRLGTSISQENGGSNLPLVWQSLIVPSYWQMGGVEGGAGCMGIKRDKSGKSSSQLVPWIWNSRPSCMICE
jgi:hypothetical protein